MSRFKAVPFMARPKLTLDSRNMQHAVKSAVHMKKPVSQVTNEILESQNEHASKKSIRLHKTYNNNIIPGSIIIFVN